MPLRPLLLALRDSLRSRNPEIEQVAIVEARTVINEVGPLVAVVYGLRSTEFRDRFDDELFGIFILNDSLTRVVRTLDVFPTSRWRDFEVHITGMSVESVHISGRGASYGDQAMQRSYSLTAADPASPPA